MAKRFIWKVWLLLNFLTKKVDNDYIAEISTAGNTLRNEDIARQIVKERSELRYETILSILNERDYVVRDAVLGGSSVQDENIHIAPRVTGNWIGADPLFNPKEHKLTFDAVPTAAFRRALDEEVGVEVLGKKTDGGAIIGLVTDVLTAKIDGTVSVNGDIIITGEKIKIAPEGEAGFGVFFAAANGTETPLDYPLSENTPKKILCRVPALADGEYTLKIVTRYSNGSTLLKAARTIVYELPIKVGVTGVES
ncbi:MAG: DUF4469 domain-containing protein [Dysgonamonadaceae bacterium]|jgi:hypothetical protein|nr:DUF4469 domain-containing protein [Dysgonamonadaceae bacterium]